MRYHYDAEGKYCGRSASEGEVAAEWIGGIAFFGFIAAVIYVGLQWLWARLSGYSSLAPPYRWFVGCYYVTLVLPVKAANSVYAWLLKATPWPNLNLVLSLAGWPVTWLLPYVCAALILRRTQTGRRIWTLCLFGPLAAIVLWFTASSMLGWLFAGPS